MQDGVMAVSPYRDDFGLHVLGRGYTQNPSASVYLSCIFEADGEHPFEFAIRPDPIIIPGFAGPLDQLACEDPTRIAIPGHGPGFMYSQVRKMSSADLKTRGKTIGDLGVYVSLGCTFPAEGKDKIIRTIVEPTQQGWWQERIDMCKEGEVILRPTDPHSDILFYEFADSVASRIAVASVDMVGRNNRTPASPAWDSKLWMDIRPGMWDSDHVSTGPIVDFGNDKLMFYNGRNENTWCIGEAVFDPLTLEIKYRSDEPIVTPPPEVGWDNQFIAFSSGVLMYGGAIHLYHHIADKRVRCTVGSF